MNGIGGGVWVSRYRGIVLPTALLLFSACALPGNAQDLNEIYKGYTPSFIASEREAHARNMGPYEQALKLSEQDQYMCKNHMIHDYRVDGLLKKGDELAANGEYQEASKLYQEVVDKFPDDMWRIAQHGIFITSALYAQRQMLKFPREALNTYRMIKDPEAEKLYEKAVRHFQLLDFAYIAERYLATSRGDDALFVLGCWALDRNEPLLALHYLERIATYHRHSDVDQAEVWSRIAYCYKLIGNKDKLAVAVKKLGGLKLTPKLQAFVRHMKDVGPDKEGLFEQKRNGKYDSWGDYMLFEPPETPLSRNDSVWRTGFPFSSHDREPELFPWVTDDSVVYKHKNVVYCLSLLTGDLRWKFDAGGIAGWYNRFGRWYPEHDVLIKDGIVYTDILKFGPSIAAIDLHTGRLKWASGPMAPQSERDEKMLYQCPPAAGENMVYAPYVYEEIEGRAHLSSTVGLRCFDGETGAVIWDRELTLLRPQTFWISKRVRRIRILSTTPTVKDGVVYHVTNAGAVAAVDALSGAVRWIARYPMNLGVVNGLHQIVQKDQIPYNRPPLIYENRVYVTPVDSAYLLCIDAETGKVLWSRPRGWATLVMAGMTGENHLLLAGERFTTVDPRDGKTIVNGLRVVVPEINKHVGVHGRATMTRDGKLFLAGGTNPWGSWGENTLTQAYISFSSKEQKIETEKHYYSARALEQINDPRSKRPETFTNTETPFRHVNRMTCRRFGHLFELEFSGSALSVYYDVEGVKKVVRSGSGAGALIAWSELAELDGDIQSAIAALEKARANLSEEEQMLRFKINRSLFRLYLHEAQRAMQINDIRRTAEYTVKMPTACTSSHDEIRSILGIAEIYERVNKPDRAARCLEMLGKHYGSVNYGVPSILLDDREALQQEAVQLLANLTSKAPERYYTREIKLAGLCMQKAVPNYFSMISPIEPDLRLETRNYASMRMMDLLKRVPADYVKDYERRSAEAFKGRTRAEELVSLVKEFPKTDAAQKAFDGMLKKAFDMAQGPDRQIEMWKLRELGMNSGLKVPDEMARLCSIPAVRASEPPLATSYELGEYQFTYDGKTKLMLLKRGGPPGGPNNLFFLGARARRMHANKFMLICWEADSRKVRWETPELRLKGKGLEVGFEEYFIIGDRVITHGLYDMLAFSLADGKEMWHLRVPHGFEIVQAGASGEVIALCGRDRTLGVHVADGRIFWEANDIGAPYCPVYFRDNLLISVRKNPSAATFRNLGTGGLLAHLDLPPLSMMEEHPALPPGQQEELPVDFDGENLLVTDGTDYIVIDTELMRVRYQKRIGNVDRSARVPYRLWINGTDFAALKKSYDIALELIATDTGAGRWGKTDEKGAEVVYSVRFDDKNIYGLRHDAAKRNIHLMGFERGSGKKTLNWEQMGFNEPEIFLDPEMRGNHLVALLKDDKDFHIYAYNKASKKVDAEIKVKGFGDFGRYGEVSYAIEGPYIGLLTAEKLITAVPK